jgi:hypothetical protein
MSTPSPQGSDDEAPRDENADEERLRARAAQSRAATAALRDETPAGGD